MYTEHFGLKKRPFRSNATGTDVFVGPQTAAVMSSIKKSLAVDDAVIAISGPVGVGKTTVVKRALATVGENRLVVSIGRLQLGYDEVIELLLAGLGARQLPKSTVQRFALFRRLLHQYGERGTRVFIVVEEATRLGMSALAELEALTAEDSGASSGASLVLMGASGLAELLRDPELARLKQRVRLRQVLQPLAAAELRGYLKHCFRLAGGEFDDIFENGTDETLFRLSGGIPRVCNSIIEQTLTTAAEQGLEKVPLELVERTAAEEIGLTVEHSVADIKAALTRAEVAKTEKEAEAVAELDAAERMETVEVVASGRAGAPSAATPKPVAGDAARAAATPEPGQGQKQESKQESKQEPKQEPKQKRKPETKPEPKPDASPDSGRDAGTAPKAAAAVDAGEGPAMPAGRVQDTVPVAPPEIPAAAADPEPTAPEDDEIPELIQDTLPDLEVLAPELAADSGNSSDDGSEDSALNDARVAPTRKSGAAPATADSGTAPVPDWERDPTLAELRPDLEALERAMAMAQGAEDSDEDSRRQARPEPAAPPPPDSTLVPEITLDREIQAKIDEATEALRQTQTDIPTLVNDEEGDQSFEASVTTDEKVEPLPRPVRETPDSAAEAASPASARTDDARKDDVRKDSPQKDHALEENARRDKAELDRIASELASARSLEDVDDKLAETLFGEEFSMAAAEIAASAPPADSANDDLELSLEDADGAGTAGSSGAGNMAGAQPPPDRKPLDEAASQRLATVRALNGGQSRTGATPDVQEMPQEEPQKASQDLSQEVRETIVMASDGHSDEARSGAEKPSSIEDQINTSMTQTLKALNARNTPVSNDDDEGKKGFFSRFRRS